MNDFDWAMQAHNAVNEMDRDIPGLSGPTITFMTGAKWQREQLRTDEATERLALKLVEDSGLDVREGWPTKVPIGTPESFKQAWMEDAAEFITALLGED